jgi:hypothetical protein
MMIEVLLSAVVYPIAAKVGEKWIDRIATGIDEKAVSLLKAAVGNPQQEQAVQQYLVAHQEVAAQLADNVKTTLEADETTSALAASLIPAPGTKLIYYKRLIDWIANRAQKFERDIVLKGFLHGENFLSYFVLKSSLSNFSNQISSTISTNFLDFSDDFYGDLKIYVEKTSSTEERDKKFRAINKKIKLSRFRRLDYEDYSPHAQVGRIFEDWVGYRDFLRDPQEEYDLLALPPELQDEIEITTYDPIRDMINSLRELVDSERDDIDRLKKAIDEQQLK